MAIIISSRVVVPSSPARRFCPVTIAEDATQTVTVSSMSCTPKTIRLGIAQGADKSFTFSDADTVNYSAASEITFDVWDRSSGSNLINKSLTGGDIVLATDYSFVLTISDTESEALTKGNKACEVWVTLSTGDRRCVGMGTFRVTDTRKYD